MRPPGVATSFVRRTLAAMASWVLPAGWSTQAYGANTQLEHGFDYALLWEIGLPALLIVLLLVCRIRCLRKEINRRKEAEERFESLLENAPDAMVIVDDSGNITFVNSRTESLFGYGRDELLGRAVELLVPEDMRTKHAELRETFRKDPSVRQMGALMRFRGMTKEGRVFPADIGVSPLKTPAGLELVASIRDATPWKEAEKALSEAEEHTRLVLDAVGEGILGLDGEGAVTFVNPSAERLLGFAARELIGRPVYERLQHTRTDGVEVPKEDSPVYLACTQGVENHSYGVSFRRKDGSCFSAECYIAPMRRKEHVIGAVVTFDDISQRVKIEEELRKNIEGLERFSKLAVGREKNMMELKKEINALLSELGRRPKYKVVAKDTD